MNAEELTYRIRTRHRVLEGMLYGEERYLQPYHSGPGLIWSEGEQYSPEWPPANAVVVSFDRGTEIINRFPADQAELVEVRP